LSVPKTEDDWHYLSREDLGLVELGRRGGSAKNRE